MAVAACDGEKRGAAGLNGRHARMGKGEKRSRE